MRETSTWERGRHDQHDQHERGIIQMLYIYSNQIKPDIDKNILKTNKRFYIYSKQSRVKKYNDIKTVY